MTITTSQPSTFTTRTQKKWEMLASVTQSSFTSGCTLYAWPRGYCPQQLGVRPVAPPDDSANTTACRYWSTFCALDMHGTRRLAFRDTLRALPKHLDLVVDFFNAADTDLDGAVDWEEYEAWVLRDSRRAGELVRAVAESTQQKREKEKRDAVLSNGGITFPITRPISLLADPPSQRSEYGRETSMGSSMSVGGAPSTITRRVPSTPPPRRGDDDDDDIFANALATSATCVRDAPSPREHCPTPTAVRKIDLLAHSPSPPPAPFPPPPPPVSRGRSQPRPCRVAVTRNDNGEPMVIRDTSKMTTTEYQNQMFLPNRSDVRCCSPRQEHVAEPPFGASTYRHVHIPWRRVKTPTVPWLLQLCCDPPKVINHEESDRRSVVSSEAVTGDVVGYYGAVANSHRESVVSISNVEEPSTPLAAPTSPILSLSSSSMFSDHLAPPPSAAAPVAPSKVLFVPPRVPRADELL
eukprot:PhM_4_TR4146/c0_g1_i3/m.22069